MSKKKKEVEDPNNTWNMQLNAALCQSPLPSALTPPNVAATGTPRLELASAVSAPTPSATLDAVLAAQAAFETLLQTKHSESVGVVVLDTAHSDLLQPLQTEARKYVLSVLQQVDALVAKGADVNHYTLMDAPFGLPIAPSAGAAGGSTPTPSSAGAALLLSPRTVASTATYTTNAKIWVTPLQCFLLRMATKMAQWLLLAVPTAAGGGGSGSTAAAAAFVLQQAVRDITVWLTARRGALLASAPVFGESPLSSAAPPPPSLSVAAIAALSPADAQVRSATLSAFPLLGSLLSLCVLGDPSTATSVLVLERLAGLLSSIVPTPAVRASPNIAAQSFFTALWSPAKEGARLDYYANLSHNDWDLFDAREGVHALDLVNAALVQHEYEVTVAALQANGNVKRIPPPPPAPPLLDEAERANVAVAVPSQFALDGVLTTVAAGALAPLTAAHIAMALTRPEATRVLMLHGAQVPFSLPVSAPGLTPLARACAMNDATTAAGLLNCGDLSVQRVTDSGGRHGHTLFQLAMAPPPPPPTSAPPPSAPNEKAPAPTSAPAAFVPSEVLDVLLERYPGAIGTPNADGEPPLVLLIKTRGLLPSFAAAAGPSIALHTTAPHPTTPQQQTQHDATMTTSTVVGANFVELLELLLVRGADPNQADGLGMTPLMHAVTAFLPDVVKKLLSLPPVVASAEGGAHSPSFPTASLRQVDIGARDAFGATALHYAAALAPVRGRGMVELLLQTEGIDVNAQDGNGQTALHRAAIRGREQQAATLLANPLCDVNAVDVHGNTALHRAVLHKKQEAVTVLLRRCLDDFFSIYGSGAAAAQGTGKPGAAAAKGAAAKGGKGAAQTQATDGTPSTKLDIDRLNKDGLTALQLAVATVRDTALASLLLQNGATVNRCGGERGGTLLHSAIWAKNTDMASLLLANGADVTLRDQEDETPLHVACRMGHVELAKLLLAHGADPHDVGACHVRTPLHYAAESYHAELIALLLQTRGGSTESQSQQQHRTTCSASWVPDGHGRTAMHLLCTDHSQGLADTAARITHHHQTQSTPSPSPPPSPTNVTALTAEQKQRQQLNEAIAAERLQGVELLLADGAPVDASDASGWLPLHCAASVPSLTAVVARLIEVNPTLLAFRDDRGWTPLHCAVVSGAVDTVKLLIQEMKQYDKGTSSNGLSFYEEQVRRVDVLDRGPMLLAAEYGQVECAKLLIRASRGQL